MTKAILTYLIEQREILFSAMLWLADMETFDLCLFLVMYGCALLILVSLGMFAGL